MRWRRAEHAAMRRSPAWIVVLALLAATAGLLAGRWFKPGSGGGEGYSHVGATRAAFVRPDPEGKPRDIGEWNGKLIVLNFWASWCAPCRAEMPVLDRIAQRHAGRGLAVIGIAVDEAAATREFLREHPVGYPILVDDPQTDGNLSTIYGNERKVLPYTVLIGRDGRILAQHFGLFDESALSAWLQPHL